eukprot:7252630-Pyramimonas_sp.AAC.1
MHKHTGFTSLTEFFPQRLPQVSIHTPTCRPQVAALVPTLKQDITTTNVYLRTDLNLDISARLLDWRGPARGELAPPLSGWGAQACPAADTSPGRGGGSE